MTTVSVVIPTYNRPQYLRSAISSVLNQTFQDFEIIVVDDASTDNPIEVINSFNEPRIKFFRHESNRGLSAARNTGIRASCGNYIALLDDDDEWLPEKLEMQVDLMDNSPPKVGVIYTGCLIVDLSNGKVLQSMIPDKRLDILDDLIITDCVIAGGSTALIRREVIERVGYFDESIKSWEAYDFWIRVAELFHFDYIEQPLAKYSYHSIRINTNYDILIDGIEEMLNKYSHLFSKNKKGNSRHYFGLGVFYCLRGDMSQGRRLIFRAIKMYPYNMKYYYNFLISLLGAGGFKKMKELKLNIPTLVKQILL